MINTGVLSLSLTVTVQVAVTLVFAFNATVIVALPTLTAVILPFSSTVTTVVSLLLQLTSLLVAFAGSTVATRLFVSSTDNSTLLSLKETSLGNTSDTVTVQVALTLFVLSVAWVAVTVMVVVPSFTAVILPFASTVAMLSSLLLHSTEGAVPSILSSSFSQSNISFVRIVLSPTLSATSD